MAKTNVTRACSAEDVIQSLLFCDAATNGVLNFGSGHPPASFYFIQSRSLRSEMSFSIRAMSSRSWVMDSSRRCRLTGSRLRMSLRSDRATASESSCFSSFAASHSYFSSLFMGPRIRTMPVR